MTGAVGTLLVLGGHFFPIVPLVEIEFMFFFPFGVVVGTVTVGLILAQATHADVFVANLNRRGSCFLNKSWHEMNCTISSMRIDILTIFPEMFEKILTTSIIGRAVGTGLVEIKVHNLRDWSDDKYKSVDDRPFGGGAGMVMRVDVVDRALNDLRKPYSKVVLMDTKGETYTQKEAENLKNEEHLIFIAPHFEGIDHRVHEHLSDKVYSIGNYVLSGGELPTMVVIDSVVRLIPGALGNPESLAEESFSEGFEIEYPQYTRPAEYKDWKVPEILLSGDHKKIAEWRKIRDKSQMTNHK